MDVSPIPPESDPCESATREVIAEDDFVLDEVHVTRIAKALSDPQRFAILASIAAEAEMPCKTLVSIYPITQATISHHLKELVAADLIVSRREGQLAILSCRREVCAAYVGALTERLVAGPVEQGTPPAQETSPRKKTSSAQKTSPARNSPRG